MIFVSEEALEAIQEEFAESVRAAAVATYVGLLVTTSKGKAELDLKAMTRVTGLSATDVARYADELAFAGLVDIEVAAGVKTYVVTV